jgi:hypothetical protein
MERKVESVNSNRDRLSHSKLVLVMLSAMMGLCHAGCTPPATSPLDTLARLLPVQTDYYALSDVKLNPSIVSPAEQPHQLARGSELEFLAKLTSARVKSSDLDNYCILYPGETTITAHGTKPQSGVQRQLIMRVYTLSRANQLPKVLLSQRVETKHQQAKGGRDIVDVRCRMRLPSQPGEYVIDLQVERLDGHERIAALAPEAAGIPIWRSTLLIR